MWNVPSWGCLDVSFSIVRSPERPKTPAKRLAASIGVASVALLIASVTVFALEQPTPAHEQHAIRIVADRNDPSAIRPWDGLRIVSTHWVAITDQRRDVLDISRVDIVRILLGVTSDWSNLGGTKQTITVYLPKSQALKIAQSFGLAIPEMSVQLLPDAEVLDWVAATPGSFALVESRDLRLGVLALTVDGHDPYRDSSLESPLRLLQWIPVPRKLADFSAFADTLAGIPRPFDPVGMAITGELIPVRCTNHVLAHLDDYDAMFDGVRDALVSADLAVAPLEHPLIADNELTPCVVTVVFTGSERAVPAMANAGLDVIFAIGNHMMDCWGGCDGTAALSETLERLRIAGLATVGAGKNLDAARAPVVIAVDTSDGPVGFAFLGYDIIAPWYHAEEAEPGTAPLKAEFLREDIAAARQLADHVIVGLNWGVEYTAHPVAYQRELGGIAMEAGASLVVGNHPHWVQALEHFRDALVAYSFGNFIFDQAWSTPTTQGMLMELGFSKDRLLGYRIRPVVIRRHSSELPWIYRPEFVDPAKEGRPILDRIWNATDRLPSRPDELVERRSE